MHKLGKTIKNYLGFPLDSACRDQVNRDLAAYLYKAGVLVCVITLLAQTAMMLIMGLRPGGPFLHARRAGYFSLYVTSFVVTLGFLLYCCWLRRKHPDNYNTILPLSVVYAGFTCLWGGGITLLDQLGGGGLNVYTSMVLTVAAFAVLRPWQAIAIFGSSGVLLNLLLPIFQQRTNDIFSNLINTLFTLVLATLIASLLYRMRVFNSHDRALVKAQYEEIQAINRKLNRQVITDELTGMNNRRYLEEVVALRLEENRQKGQPTAGMMLDIDYFKQFNDHYGHLAGDRCLQDIAQVLLQFVDRENACAVRYGGEEFFICLFDCDEAQALRKAEELRCDVAEQTTDNDFCVTVSIGVYTDGSCLEELVERSDRALYEAKRQGRNRVVAFSRITADEDVPDT